MIYRVYYKFKGDIPVYWYADFQEWMPLIHKTGVEAREDFFHAIRSFLVDAYYVDAPNLSKHEPVDGVPYSNAVHKTWSDPIWGSSLEDERGVICLKNLFQ